MHLRGLSDEDYAISDLWCLQSWAGYLGRVERSRKAGQGKESLTSTFACFVTAAASLVSGGRTGRWAMSPLKFKIFIIFPYFLRS